MLTLAAEGTYVWKAYAQDPPEKYLRGKWRDATVAEMKYAGGAGVVLLQAKGTWDWIVLQDRATTLNGQRIQVLELKTRQVREFGAREAPAGP